jgi:hypothetical protein
MSYDSRIVTCQVLVEKIQQTDEEEEEDNDDEYR